MSADRQGLVIAVGRDDRGQAFTLEGLAAALLILLAVLYALQGIVVTPTTPGTIDRQTRSELATQGGDLLSAARANGSLVEAALYWNGSRATFYSSSHDLTQELGYGQERPPGAFGRMLNQTFAQRGLRYNVYITFRQTNPTESDRVVYVKRGVPTDNAIMSRFVVTLYDNMTLTSPAGHQKLENLGVGGFYAPDVDPNGPLYNVVEIEVVVW